MKSNRANGENGKESPFNQ